MSRLTDNDRHFGPVTYARTDWKPIRLVLSSGDRQDERRARNTLTAYAFGWVARINLPTMLAPHVVRHTARSWDEATINRMGRDWYEETFPREYGFSLSNGFLQVFLGPQTHDSVTTKSWCRHLPWTQWRHVRYSLYDLRGTLFWEQRQRNDIRGMKAFTDQYEAQKVCPAARFVLRDYDGAEVIATTRIDEREWKFGEGWFKWLSLFRKPMIKRRLDIDFSAETGPEKGSWKGGTTGTTIEMLPGEMHEAAMRRYCEQEQRAKYGSYRIEFAGAAPQPAEEVAHA